ncbi:PREDICTED: uncharacterized protein LOC106724288 isoform X2 [Myotis brandtii]|uniref:uncharacterized protein LOC106724288 isoform X2 n=1 Tax=Myotis brandtii TaxID=109478 RepID=UPI0007044951|nr:PREDICTED: uncharacterized protein LOC106724288 isoform X2 [Myotis brandtii]
MEANVQLMRVIQEMRAEINKLEKENQALRMKLTSNSQRTPGSGGHSGDEREEEVTDIGNLVKVPGQSPATLHNVISTDSEPDAQQHQVHSFAANDPWKSGKRHPSSRILEAQRMLKPLTCSSIKKQDNEEKAFAEDSFTSKSSSHRAFPEYVPSGREKIKAVSFLLPMDIASYSKNSSSLKYSPNQTTNQLNTITE